MDTLSYKTISANSSTVEKQWVIVDAQSAILGRLASDVAKILRGKTKPSFTPNVDCGDNVIVINSDKVRLTGDKWDAKVYVRHTGYPGGQRISTPRLLKQKSSTILIEKAVKGMLPKNKLRAPRMKRLKIFSGDEHSYDQQLNPKKKD